MLKNFFYLILLLVPVILFNCSMLIFVFASYILAIPNWHLTVKSANYITS